jgi:hypothetical protein
MATCGKFRLCKLFRAYQNARSNVECKAVALMTILLHDSISTGEAVNPWDSFGSSHERNI